MGEWVDECLSDKPVYVLCCAWRGEWWGESRFVYIEKR